jgi:hypothetical protein
MPHASILGGWGNFRFATLYFLKTIHFRSGAVIASLGQEQVASSIVLIDAINLVTGCIALLNLARKAEGVHPVTALINFHGQSLARFGRSSL